MRSTEFSFTRYERKKSKKGRESDYICQKLKGSEEVINENSHSIEIFDEPTQRKDSLSPLDDDFSFEVIPEDGESNVNKIPLTSVPFEKEILKLKKKEEMKERVLKFKNRNVPANLLPKRSAGVFFMCVGSVEDEILRQIRAE